MRKAMRWLAITAVFGCSAALARPDQPGANGPMIDEAVRGGMDVKDYTLQDLVLPQDGWRTFTTELSIGGERRTLFLEPFSVRAEDFKVYVQDANGYHQIPPPAEISYRGTVVEIPNSLVTATLDRGRLKAQVLLNDGLGTAVYVQPLTDVVPGAARDTHVVYTSADTVMRDWTCGINPGNQDRFTKGVKRVGGDGSSRAINICEIACDADVEFFVKNGSSEQNTVNDVTTIITNVSGVYENECSTRFVITTVIVRVVEPDPYTSTNPETLLNQFTNYWNANHQGVHRDIAHLFTGKNMNGGVIGIAFLSVVCSQSSGYGLSESRYTNNMNNRVALTAHEIGHNFSAPHCDGQNPCHIMCSGLGGCNGLGGNPPIFGTVSAPIITNYANNRNCLSDDNVIIDPPLFDDFPSLSINGSLWQSNSGAAVSTAGSNEPSTPNSVNLDGASDVLTSVTIRMQNVSDPVLRFWTEHVGAESGERLRVQYFNSSNAWTTLVEYTSNGVNQTNYEFHSVNLPADARHNAFAFRFQALGNEANDDWYIDDVYCGERPFDGYTPPFTEDWPTTVPDEQKWPAISGAVVTANAFNEPSAPNSINLDNADSFESNIIKMAGVGNGIVSFYTERFVGVEAGKTLRCEYRTNGGQWVVLGTLISDGLPQSTFSYNEFQVPANGLHDNFAVRFSAQGTDSTDDWFIDDIFVGAGGACQADCDQDGICDATEIAQGAPDCNANGIPDDCDVNPDFGGLSPDCQQDGVPDECQLAGGNDCDGNGVPDECDPDCNGNGFADACDILFGLADDCNNNGVPDSCDLDQGGDCNDNGELDVCEGLADCDTNGVPDLCELAGNDCNGNGQLDACEDLTDCDDNGVADICELAGNDCDGDGLLDACDTFADCDQNGEPDECDPNFCPPDLAPPFGTLNVFDFLQFQNYFSESDACSDLAPPFGQFNVFDFLEFQNAFSEGC